MECYYVPSRQCKAKMSENDSQTTSPTVHHKTNLKCTHRKCNDFIFDEYLKDIYINYLTINLQLNVRTRLTQLN